MSLLNFLPKEEQYFSLFAQMTSYIYDAATELVRMVNDPNGNYEDYSKRIKTIEHTCDELTHSIATRLNRSFITPFDREDIYMMSGALDDIVDLIDDAASAMVMYDVRQVTPHSRRFAEVIQRMAIELHEVVQVLAKPSGITPRLVRLHSLENEGDAIYHEAIAKLFRDETDPMNVIRWKDIYEKLEAAVDRCENVANIIESVVIKHT